MKHFKLFLWKFRNRLLHAFRLSEIWRSSVEEKLCCQRCGCHRWVEFVVPDSQWNKLPKKWQTKLLCINCFLDMVPNCPDAYIIRYRLSHKEHKE